MIVIPGISFSIKITLIADKGITKIVDYIKNEIDGRQYTFLGTV